MSKQLQNDRGNLHNKMISNRTSQPKLKSAQNIAVSASTIPDRKNFQSLLWYIYDLILQRLGRMLYNMYVHHI